MNEKRFSFVSMSGLRALMCAVLVAVGLAACSDKDDNPVVNPQLVEQIQGEWILINDFWGEEDEPYFEAEDFDDVEGIDPSIFDYHREVVYVNLQKSGKGSFIFFIVDQNNEPVGKEGDYLQMYMDFDYAIQSDGSIKVLNVTDIDGFEDKEEFRFRYDNGSLIADDGETQFTLHRVSDDEAAQLDYWMPILGYGAADWNINTSDMLFGAQRTRVPALTVDNWQDHEDIFIYVQNGGDQDIYDAETGNQVFGFEHHKLPWSRGANESPNLPESIWKEVWNDGVKEGNPWRLAMMQIGENSTKNGNFLAFYNKYTGVLRFFFYVHEGITSNGSTHWWGLQMNDLLASRSVFRYGVPLDRNITNAASKAALNQPDFMGQLVTPWVANNFNGASLPLQAGWWAYDLDLSLYRGSEATISTIGDRDNALLMNLFAKENMQAQLSSLFEGTIDGNIDLEATYANSENGKSGGIGEIVGKVKDIGMGLKDIYDAAMKDDVGGSLKGLVALGKKGAIMAGLMEEEKEVDPKQLTGMKGTINMTMKGKMDTKGMLSTERGISGFAGMVLKRDNFIYDNIPTFGEGVWNIETPPVVYFTNAYVDWRYEYKWWGSSSGGIGFVYYTDKKSPFGGQSITRRDTQERSESNEPFRGHVAYFDPSSIKIKLNPNLFTPEEIASAKVSAVCGVRKGMAHGSHEAYRQAQKLRGSEFGINGNVDYPNRAFGEAPFDGLSGADDKMGLSTGVKFAVDTYKGRQFGVFGRGDSDYLIEPQSIHGNAGSDCMPAYEITVTVTVMHNGKPIIYSRNYLPEYKEININNLPTKSDLESRRPAEYDAAIYSQQAKHINDIRNWTRRTFIPNRGQRLGFGTEFIIATGYEWDNPAGGWPNLIDGDTNSEWISRTQCKDDGSIYDWDTHTEGKSVATDAKVWYCEFQTRYPVSPTSWTLWNAVNGNISERNPSHCALYGKKKNSDAWTMLDNEHPSAYLPTTHGGKTFGFNRQQPKDMQYFRFEVFGNYGDPVLGLSELIFNYAD
ncbi:MAG: hypothetical protein IJ693_05660 [Bacteroidaceae bacterium]|nr:hypothetical protein [Bacteroidaceae bacterium]